MWAALSNRLGAHCRAAGSHSKGNLLLLVLLISAEVNFNDRNLVVRNFVKTIGKI